MVLRKLIFIIEVIILLVFFQITSYAKISSGLDLIPSKVKGVYGLNDVSTFRKISDVKKYEKKYKIKLNDIDTIYGASFDGNISLKISKMRKMRPDGVMVVQTKRKFKQSNIYLSIKKSRQTQENKFKGITYLKASKSNNYSFVFLDNRFLVSAKEPRLKIVMNLYLGKGSNVQQNRLFRNHIRAIENSNTFWAVGNFSSATRNKLFSSDQLKPLQKINLFRIAHQGSYCDIKGYFSNEQDAKKANPAMQAFFNFNFTILFLKTRLSIFSMKGDFTSKKNVSSAKYQ